MIVDVLFHVAEGRDGGARVRHRHDGGGREEGIAVAVYPSGAVVVVPNGYGPPTAAEPVGGTENESDLR